MLRNCICVISRMFVFYEGPVGHLRVNTAIRIERKKFFITLITSKSDASIIYH